MKLLRTLAAVFALSLTVVLALPQQTVSTATSPAVRSMERKLEHIESNAERRTPDPAPTVLNEDEVNAYVNSGAVHLPRGVQRVHLEGLPGAVTADMQVDFDQITQGSRSMNPLLALFSGVHQVQVATHAYGQHGVGFVHVDRVSLDNVEVPPIALEFFIDRYIKPKRPEIGLDSRFQMPDRIDTAVAGQRQVTIVQR
ncbi:MAG: hypothetical protein ACHP7P_03620 [Terriglobales bacterium]